MIVALTALVVAMGGSATAAVLITSKQIKNNSIRGIDVKRGSLTGSDVKNRSLTPADFRGSVQGPAGAKGDKGDPGAAGAPGAPGERGEPATRYFARVSSGGALLSGSPGASSSRTDVGRYSIKFGGVILTDCAVSAIIETPGGQGNVRRSSTAAPDEVLVRAFTADGTTPLDIPVNVAVFC
jgi:hypothetical protein